VRFPRRQRIISLGYNSICSDDLDKAIRKSVAPDRFRLRSQIQEVGTDHVVVDGERIETDGIIDARGASSTPKLELAWQKFVGRTYRFATPHGQTRPIIMDALVEQTDGYRFIYSLPLDNRELLIEDTYYSADPGFDGDRLRSGLDHLAARHGEFDQVGEEMGVLPIILNGDIESLWPNQGPAIARLGMRGGFFHPTTGYSLPDAVRNAAILCNQRELRSQGLHALFRGRASKLWDERRFFQLLNRMLFFAAEPDQRYRVLEHFYRLPVPLIARFYAARLTALDKVRILSGRPPVPVMRALAVLRRNAA
jgi:lycopene beta-cyclase